MKFILPLEIKQSNNKMFKCNMNIYRNTHGKSLSRVKNNYKDLFWRLYGDCPVDPSKLCRIHYTIYFPNNRAADLMNVGAVVDKFASDCLTEFGYIEDDNRRILKKVSFEDGGIDRENPRAELELIELINDK